MTTRALMVAILAAAAGCGGGGSYELVLAIACTPPEAARCRVASVRQCSAAGIDAVEVVAAQGGDRRGDRFPCFTPGLGAVARGPALDPGPAALAVTPLGPSGLRLAPPVRLSLTIPAEGYARAHVSLPRPAACADGVDNDGDGRVDLLDPGCKDAADTSER